MGDKVTLQPKLHLVRTAVTICKYMITIQNTNVSFQYVLDILIYNFRKKKKNLITTRLNAISVIYTVNKKLIDQVNLDFVYMWSIPDYNVDVIITKTC